MPTHGRHDRIRDGIIGVAAVAAIALAAASISGVAGMGGGEVYVDTGGFTAPGSTGSGSGDLPFGGGSGEATSYMFGTCIAFLASIPGTVAYFGLFAAGLYGLQRRYNTGTAVLGFYGSSPVVLVAYFASTSCPTANPGQIATPGPGPGPGGGFGLGAGAFQVSPVVLGGVLAVALVGAAAVIARMSGGQTTTAAARIGDDGDGGADAADLAAAAGRAADRLEGHNADVDNEVYRAWWQMTQLLDVSDPETATPREFAAAARSAGVAAADADQLTTLFEEVRYGERDPARREEHALDVFRSIEAAYGDEVQSGHDERRPGHDERRPGHDE